MTTPLTVVAQSPLGSYPTLQPVALTCQLVFVPATVVGDGIVFANSGRDLLFVRNPTAGALTVTITSIKSHKNNRSGDITTYSIPAYGFAWFGPFDPLDWNQTDGTIIVKASDINMTFAIVRLPVVLFPTA